MADVKQLTLTPSPAVEYAYNVHFDWMTDNVEIEIKITKRKLLKQPPRLNGTKPKKLYVKHF